MAGTNYVGAVTITAGTAVDLFATTGVPAAAGVWSLQGVLTQWGLCQVNSATSPSAETAYALPADETLAVGSTAVFLYNPSAASITFNARFSSTA